MKHMQACEMDTKQRIALLIQAVELTEYFLEGLEPMFVDWQKLGELRIQAAKDQPIHGVYRRRLAGLLHEQLGLMIEGEL